ncbi:Hypothetical protein I595_935 [Croceitalea dokdonensis DOKDO 023]|uniref:Uncharacterized protein n=1 Tax=Croceitalea dokdonensis DOKDO 023 TaxID=1300341 RepID=A0A0P7AGG2_9FLAO|nr:Hypothetical protein I595_935 [Croceitalea dokdonensis DOKDO 023]
MRGFYRINGFYHNFFPLYNKVLGNPNSNLNFLDVKATLLASIRKL